MLVVRVPYCYEYLGDTVHQVWTRSFEKSMYTFLTAYSMKYFPLIKGNSSLGKHVLVQEVARMLAQNLIDRPITPLTGSERVIQFLKGAAYSGAWLCCSTIDRLREDHMSALVSEPQCEKTLKGLVYFQGIRATWHKKFSVTATVKPSIPPNRVFSGSTFDFR